MLTPEFYVFSGISLVVFSSLLIWVALCVRTWFFQPELRSELQVAAQPERK